MDALRQGAIDYYHRYCKKHGLPPHAQIDTHTCSIRCRHVEFSDKKLGKAFICTFSKKVHCCAYYCSEAEETSEGYVCRLTGHVLPYNIERFYVKRQRGCDNKFVVNPPIKMGTSGKARCYKPKHRFDTDAARTFLQNAFYGPARISKYRAKKAAFSSYAKRLSKTAKRDGVVDFIEIQTMLLRELNRIFGCNAEEPVPFTSVRIETLIRYIHKFWDIHSNVHTNKTANTTLVFTATCLSRLRTGYKVNGIEVFPKIEWVHKYAPPDTFYAVISNFKCRSLSLMWRKILANTIDSKSMLPNRRYVFKLK